MCLASWRSYANDGAIALAPDDDVFAPGTKVEVRQRFDGRWARGFVVDSYDDDGYRVCRPSDGTVLPVAFPPDDIREERKRSGMWWA